MNDYTAHQLVKIRHHDLIAEADRARLVREARLAARGTSAPGRQPLIWLRDTVDAFAAQVVTLTRTHGHGH